MGLAKQEYDGVMGVAEWSLDEEGFGASDNCDDIILPHIAGAGTE